MSEVGVKQLKNATSRVIEQVEGGERVIVTKRGRPAAVIMSIADAEDYVLAHAEEFLKMRLEGRRDYERGRSISIDEI